MATNPNPAVTVMQQALKQPNAVAIDFGEGQLLYRDYVQLANELAGKMRLQGVGKGDHVVLFIESGKHIPVGLLAILLLGAVYVPLDPSFPEARIKVILEDVQPKLILTERQYQQSLPPKSAVLVLEQDLEEDLSAGIEAVMLEPAEVDDESPAYVFYTSGTTGLPKGVLLSYGNLAFFMQSAAAKYRFSPGDRHLSVAKPTFSISLFDLLLPFICGGSLYLRSRNEIMAPSSLSLIINKISCFHMGPALLGALVRFSRENGLVFPNITHMSSGGDMVPPDLLESCKEVFPSAEIWVIYGCTEVACMALTWQIQRDVSVEVTYVGKPFPAGGVKLIPVSGDDETSQQAGEVFIRGAGLATKYLNQPELTRQKFIEIEGERYYGTGDLGRLAADGNIRLLGRSDFQIKVNGIRIEVEEIESWLRKAEGVAAANVVGAKTPKGDSRIVAFVVMAKNGRFSEKLLREFVSVNLPDYMIPDFFIELEAMPLNINLKVDRRAMVTLAEEFLSEAHDDEHIAHEPVRQLADLWRQSGVTGYLSESSDFFEVGGNSLAAAELVLLVKKNLNVELDISEVYAASVLGEQADYIGSRRALPTEDRQADSRAAFCQVGLFFRQLFEGSNHSLTVDQFLKYKGKLNQETVSRVVQKLIERHEMLRSSFHLAKGGLSIRTHDFSENVVPQVVRRQPGKRADELMTGNFDFEYMSFPLDKGPMLGACIYDLDGDESMLQLSAHHLACDDHSMGILLDEFARLYTDYEEKGVFPELPASFRYSDFVAGQYQKLESPNIDSVAAGLIDSLETNADKFLSSNPFGYAEGELGEVHKTESKQFPLSTLTADLEFSDLIAVLAYAIKKATGHSDQAFASLVALRRGNQENPAVGMFVNVVPLFLKIDESCSLADARKQARGVLRESLKTAHIPFEYLMKKTRKAKRMNPYPFHAVVNEYSGLSGLAGQFSNFWVSRPGALPHPGPTLTLVNRPDDQSLVDFEYPANAARAKMFHELMSLVEDSLRSLKVDG